MRFCQICIAQPTSPTLSQKALCPWMSPQALAQVIPCTPLTPYYKTTAFMVIQCPSVSKRAAAIVAQALRRLSVLWRLKRQRRKSPLLWWPSHRPCSLALLRAYCFLSAPQQRSSHKTSEHCHLHPSEECLVALLSQQSFWGTVSVSSGTISQAKCEGSSVAYDSAVTASYDSVVVFRTSTVHHHCCICDLGLQQT